MLSIYGIGSWFELKGRMIPFPGDTPAFFLSRRLVGKISKANPSDRKRPRQLSVRVGSGAAFSLYIDQN